MEAKDIRVYAPVPEPRDKNTDRYARKKDDTDRTYAWRQRMKTEEAKVLYRQRAATAETVNGDLRAWRGLRLLPVRGQTKVRGLALLQALTYNLLRWMSLEGATA